MVMVMKEIGTCFGKAWCVCIVRATCKGRCQYSRKADKPTAAEKASSKDLCIELQTAGSAYLKERGDLHAKLDKGGIRPIGMFPSFPGSVCSMKYWAMTVFILQGLECVPGSPDSRNGDSGWQDDLVGEGIGHQS